MVYTLQVVLYAATHINSYSIQKSTAFLTFYIKEVFLAIKVY